MVGKIVGTGSYVPKTIWDNHKIAKLVETSDAWIRERTGIVQRHIAESDTAVTIAVEAAKCALQNGIENGGITSGAEIDAIFVCAVAPEILLPAVACEVQKEVGAIHAFAYDMNKKNRRNKEKIDGSVFGQFRYHKNVSGSGRIDDKDYV